LGTGGWQVQSSATPTTRRHSLQPGLRGHRLAPSQT
jgi:hypothetical protein